MERATPCEATAFPRSFGVQTLLTAAFCLFCFLYVWLRIEPTLEYQRFAPEFFFRYSFFAQFPGYPGGLAEYAAAFLAQLNFHNWLGALVFTLLNGSVCFLLGGLLRATTGTKPGFAILVIPFLLLIFRSRYLPFTIPLAIGLVPALGLSLVIVLFLANPRSLRWSACWILGVLIFYVAGAWALVTFALLCGLDELLRRKSPVGALLALSGVAIIPIWLLVSTNLDTGKILNPWGKGIPLVWAAAVYALAPLIVGAFGLLNSSVGQKLLRAEARVPAPEGKSHQKSHHHHAPKSQPVSPSFWVRRKAWLQAALFVAGCAVVWLTFNTRLNALAQIEYFTAVGSYEKVLPIAAGVSRKDLDPASEIRLQSALYHTGRLCEDLFSFRNQSSWNVLPGLSLGLEACRPQSRVLLELGLVSDAEHYAHEALEVEGDRPETLRLLASVNILKQRPKAARVFLSALSRAPFQEAWARHELSALAGDTPLADKTELERVRSCMFTNDLAHESLPIEPLLRQLLHRNENNRMAFEYLMVDYLIHLQTDKIVEALPALDIFGYKQIPRHLEEAVLLHQKLRNTAVDLHGRAVRPETIRRFEQFSACLERGLDRTAEGRRELTRDFGDTFWYFYLAQRNR